MTTASDAVAALYRDVQRCAQSAGLVYVEDEAPGISRTRRGKGFCYRTANGTLITDIEMKQRLAALAIPPAWRSVWICPDPDGHLLATGEDDRGRKQYIYHPKWRELRDMLNAYRLIAVGESLPAVRRHVSAQLRRRTMDRDRVVAAMIRILDSSGIRIGNEVYADENDSVGLTTLTSRHVRVDGAVVEFDFPAKSGQRARIAITDPQVAAVVEFLRTQRRRRLFTVAGEPVSAPEVNAALGALTADRMTAKDFRTWRGTLAAFCHLRRHLDADPETTAIAAVDAAATELGNTRAVARDHYVHPHLLASFADGTLAQHLTDVRPRRTALLDPDERRLLAVLERLLADLDNDLAA
ncbi:MAG TPA: DNA topoisomerase IB [Jatrophihabitantaceae bacterium]|jgi:DNA topoisomerase-1